MPAYDEETPLLRPSRTSAYLDQDDRINTNDIHLQFCLLAGVPPSNLAPNARQPKVARRSLYGRAIHRRNAQNRTYLVTASLSNTLLLSQVVLGAALTGLGASGSSHILITVFGALNTIIAGVVAYLKSRGQPMRARMFRDDLDRVVDEIENSEVMWLGIQHDIHGYDEIAIDDSVSVRSEVARLTRLYDKVVKNNTMNDPDMYMNVVGDGSNAALRARPGQMQIPAADATTPSPAPPATAPAISAPPDASAATGVVIPPVATPDDPDASPASAPPKSKTPEPSEDKAKAADPSPAAPPPPTTAAADESSKPLEESQATLANGQSASSSDTNNKG